MSQLSSRFKLPYIMPGQAQKHVTHNEAVRALDTLLHVSVIARDMTAPPSAPSEGDFYLMGDMPSVEVAAYANYLLGFVDGAWMYYPPVQGLIVNIENEAKCVIWRGTQWTEFGTGGSLDISALSFDIFGINGTADNYNRLVLNSDASLFNHNGAGHQLKINKAAAPDTASLLFQDNFSGRAEMGLAGDNDFSIKVSVDGAEFKSAMTVDQESGEAHFPNSPHLIQPVIFNMFGDGGRFGGKPEPLDVRLNSGFVVPDYIRSFNGSVLSEGDKYIDNSNNLGGDRGQMPPHMTALAERFKPGASNTVLRYGTEFYTLSVIAGTGTGGALIVGGETAYLAVTGLRFPMPPRYTLSFWIRVTSGLCIAGNNNQTRLLIDGAAQTSDIALPADGAWHHIERFVSYTPNQFVGYEANPYRIYASPGAGFQMAAPVLFPGTLAADADQPTAIVNALTAFM